MYKEKSNFLKIPINRIIMLGILDVMAILIASFMSIYLRFEFKFGDIPRYFLEY